MMMVTMKSSIPGLFLLFLLSSTLSGQASVLVKSFMQFPNVLSWQDAQQFCKSSHFYTDLAVITDQTEANSLYLESYFAWVNLHKTGLLSKWTWPDGQNLNLSHWAGVGGLLLGDSCGYVNYITKMFYNTNCTAYYFFICYQLNNKIYEYTFINQSKTWSDAQLYCKNAYDDLAVIENEVYLTKAVHQQDFPVWTGLYRDGETWQWSMGQSDYRNWAPNQPGKDGDCVAISSVSKTMMTQSCSTLYPFICFKDNLVLVKENKTWEEALEYCKVFGSQNSPHQLVSVQPEDYSYMMGRVMEANTEEVWTGLRFLAGNWMWVNGADMLLPDLPLCPVSGQNCGAFSKSNADSLETRDCVEKKNILCYSLG